ncbi:hypothetical protein PV325_004091 [Microctonus aethiopoides]|nr:hypothetical protein PV325_004091 [Microctonus aethiopoides]
MGDDITRNRVGNAAEILVRAQYTQHKEFLVSSTQWYCRCTSAIGDEAAINEAAGVKDKNSFSASPEHWCRIPELDNMTNFMSLEDRKSLSLPYTIKSDGRRQYSKCYMYDVNYTAILQNWLQHENHIAFMNGDITSFTSLTSPQLTRIREFRPPVSSSDWPTTKCLHGWTYDKRDYDSTLVTEFF